jgi:hypothetical protein
VLQITRIAEAVVAAVPVAVVLPHHSREGDLLALDLQPVLAHSQDPNVRGDHHPIEFGSLNAGARTLSISTHVIHFAAYGYAAA